MLKMRARHTAPPTVSTGPQAAPLSYADVDGMPGSIKVDRVVSIGGRILVAGWSTAPVDLALRSGTDEASTLFRTVRPDVAAHFGLPSGDSLGFVLVGPAGGNQVELIHRMPGRQTVHALTVEPARALDDNASALMMPAIVWLAGMAAPLSAAWRELIAMVPSVATTAANAAGALDSAVASAVVAHGVAVGWLVAPRGTVAWLQDGEGGFYSLVGAFRSYRDDVQLALSHNVASAAPYEPGFVVHLEGVRPGMRLALKALVGDAVVTLSEVTVSALPPNPVDASRKLFAATEASLAHVAERIRLIDAPILDALITEHRSHWPDIPVRVREYGASPAQPVVSMVIPLYGRADFVEHQMLEFTADPWLCRHAELIYVVDDRSLVDQFTSEAPLLHRLYRVPFRWVWGGLNRGFAGANNLGAAHSRAPFLLFMNSDVFPAAPGWIEPMLDVLRQRPDAGVVAPRLHFADGGIQHGGMEFHRREDLGIWINHHPRMGLDPMLDPHAGPTDVPAVTGACMAMRRTDFDAVGGWDTGYLIGDFEDSDLCLKLAARGLASVYLPAVGLTHLERQSFRLLGQSDFRTRVVIYNALRHQRRWQDRIAAAMGGEA